MDDLFESYKVVYHKDKDILTIDFGASDRMWFFIDDDDDDFKIAYAEDIEGNYCPCGVVLENASKNVEVRT